MAVKLSEKELVRVDGGLQDGWETYLRSQISLYKGIGLTKAEVLAKLEESIGKNHAGTEQLAQFVEENWRKIPALNTFYGI